MSKRNKNMARLKLKHLVLIFLIFLFILIIFDYCNIPTKIGFKSHNINNNLLGPITSLIVACLGYLLVDSKVPDKEVNLKEYNSKKLNTIVGNFIYEAIYNEEYELQTSDTHHLSTSDIETLTKFLLFTEHITLKIHLCFEKGYLYKGDYQIYDEINDYLNIIITHLKYILKNEGSSQADDSYDEEYFFYLGTILIEIEECKNTILEKYNSIN